MNNYELYYAQPVQDLWPLAQVSSFLGICPPSNVCLCQTTARSRYRCSFRRCSSNDDDAGGCGSTAPATQPEGRCKVGRVRDVDRRAQRGCRLGLGRSLPGSRREHIRADYPDQGCTFFFPPPLRERWVRVLCIVFLFFIFLGSRPLSRDVGRGDV